MNTFRLIVLTTSLAMGIGCADKSDDSDDKREPMFTIKANITSFTGSLDGVEATVLWADPAGDDQAEPVFVPGTTVPVAGSLPAAFTLDLYTPPPDELMSVPPESPPGTPRVALGSPGLVRAGAPEADPSAIRTLSWEYNLIYADGPVDWPAFPKVAAGYHLLRFAPTMTDEEIEQCVEDAIAGGATQEQAFETCLDVTIQEITSATPISLAFE